MKNVSIKIACALGAALILGGCNTPETEYGYVELGQVSCSFLADGNDPVTIAVRSSFADWKATPGASWIRAEKSEDGKSLIISVEVNEDSQERASNVTVTAADAVREIKVNQLGKDGVFARFRKLDTFQMGAAISPSGKYAGGFETTIADDDSFQFWPTMVNIETGEWIQYGPFSETLMPLHQTIAITDQGKLFITDGTNGGQVVFELSGDYDNLPLVDGFECKPEVQGTSADGKYWVGMAKKAPGIDPDKPDKNRLMYPILWTDGVGEALPLPEKNYRDEEIWYGAMARGISANGEVIYGTSWENFDFGMMYWKKGANGWEVNWVGKDVRKVTPVTMEYSDGTEYDYHIVDGMTCQAQLTNISPSGKWISGTFRYEEVAENRKVVNETKYAGFYNTETETTIIVKDYGESTGTHVTDDGIAFIGLGTFGISAGKVYDLNTMTDLGDTEDWVLDNYGIMMPMGYIIYQNEAQNVIFGTSAQASAMGVGFINWYVAPPLQQE